MTKHNAKFISETGYAFNLNKMNSQQMRSRVCFLPIHRSRNTSVKCIYIKQIGFVVACSLPGYKESCTSIFIEEFRSTVDFSSSISGIVTTSELGCRAAARFDPVDVISGCRARLRESQQITDG